MCAWIAVDLQRLSKDELIELVMRLQRPDKTSRTSSKPPSTDRKETRENSRPGGAKPGHEPHNRRLADNPDAFRDHKPILCGGCGGALGSDIKGRLTVARKKRELERWLADILATPTACDLAQQLQGKIGRARDQLLTFCDYPGEVDATNNGSERRLRPCVIQRKITNGYRAMWAAQAEADVRTTVDTARLRGANPFDIIVGTLA